MKKWNLLALSGLLLGADLADASGFRLSNQNAFVTGRGNAFVATANNASAIYYNPAGLTQLEKTTVELGSYVINFNVDHTRDATRTSTDNSWQAVPHFFYAKPQEKISWGFGIYAPFGLSNNWDVDNSPFSTITKDAEVSLITLSPAIAYKINEKFSVGMTLNIRFAELDLTQGVGLAPDDDLNFKGDDEDIGFTLGAFWEPSDEHNFGFKYRNSAKLNLEGTTRYQPAGLTGRSTMDAELPDILTVGYSYKPNELWDFGLDLEYIRWSSFDESTITDSPLGDLLLPFNWENGYIWQLGFTRYLTSGYSLSAGYNYNENVQPDFLYNPAVSDADRHWFNFSLAKHTGSWPWSIGYQYGTSDRTVSGDVPRPLTFENANGTYDTEAHSLIFTLGYQF